MYRINLFSYLEETAARLPDKLAFCDERESLTFAELYRRASALGTAIARRTEGARCPIVLLTERAVSSVVGLLGALAAGDMYVPLDAKMPDERLRTILSSLSPSLILYAEPSARVAESLGDAYPLLPIEAHTEVDEAPLIARRARVIDLDPAYMIFTSGSTGVPKGIPVSHRSVIDFTEWMADSCGITEGDILANQAPFYFDLSVKDLYQTLRHGCTTYILPKKLFLFPTMLVDFLNTHGVTALIWATSAFRLLAQSGVFPARPIPSLSRVILGGEALLATHLNIWRRAHPACTFINLYGPTEVTVDCTAFTVEREYEDGEAIPIGRACRNMEILLLDESLRPVAPGEAGEICVRGTGLALGYFGDPEKTAAAFIQNPLNPHYPDRLYRTGDIARENAEGDLIFLSRRDGQIKHMGYRIELGEIEAALSAVDGVAEAACLFDPAADAIVCYCVTQLDAAALTRALGTRMPRYMIPNVWRTLPALPTNRNGKIDRARLKELYNNEKA